MITRRYAVVSFIAAHRAPKLVTLLNNQGIRAFAVPMTDEPDAQQDVLVDAADIDQAAYVWRKEGFIEQATFLLDRRQSIDLPRFFERTVLKPGSGTMHEVKVKGEKVIVSIPPREYRDD